MKSEKVLLLAFAAFVFALVPERSGAQEIITNPWLQNVYTNRFTVMCETRGEMEGLSVQYGDDLVAPMTSTNGLKEGTFVYAAAVEGPTALPAGATIPYCLATNGVAIAGTEGSVKLWADGNADFTCAIWGDNQEGVHEYDWGFDDTTERYRCVREMFKHMSAQKPDFGFTTGDVSSFADYDNEIEPGDLRAADDLFCKGQTPYHLIWGNHDCVGTFFGEVYTNAAQRYFAPAATEEDGWFHVYRNDVLFIGVHWTWGQEGQDERYERILKEVAELLETPRAKQAKFRILMQHAPVFLELYNVLPGIEWFDDSRTHDVAVKGGVDLIFSGHTHAYERIERDGMIQITNGGMGYLDHGERCYKNFGTDTKVGGHQNTPYLWARQTEKGGALAPAMPVRMGCFASYGMLKVEGDTLKYTAHAFDANGDYIGVADSFEIESKTRSEVKVGGEGEQRNVKPFTPTALTAPVNNATWKDFKTAQGEAWEVPEGQKGDDPVVNVSKTEIARFCAALNAGQETNYRLPTVKELTEIFGGDLKREVSEWTIDVDPNTGWCRILGGNKKAVDGTWCRAYDKPAIATADCHANYLGFRVVDAADPIPEVTVMDRALAKLAEIENPAEVYLWSALKGKLVDISDEWTKPTTLDKKTYGAPVIFTGKGPLVYRVRREVSFDGGLAAPNATALNIAHVLDLGPVSKPVTIKGEVRGGVSTNEWTFALRCDELTLNNVLYRGQALNVVTDSRALHLAGTNDFSGAVMTVCCDRKLPDPFKDCVTNLVTDSAATLKLRALHFSNRGVVEEVLVDKPAGLTVGENVTLVTAENVLFGIDGSALTVNGALDAAGIDIEGHLMGLLPQAATLGGSGEVTTTHFGMCDVSTLYVDVTNTTVRSSIPYRTYTACTNGCNVVYRAPRQPNYADATGNDWLYNHAIAGKACSDEAVETGVDLFYVYPTIAGGEQIVIDGFRGIDDETMRSSEPSFSTAVGAFVLSARCLADMTHVYAPFYRQATLATAYDISTNALGEVKATANADYLKCLYEGPAYADVTNALDVYFAKWNNGRPFVLAAHSQGSAILRLLMKHYFARPENRDKAKRLVCSYQIGFGVSAAEMEDVTAATGITFAERADDTNVIVSYNTMGEGSSGNSVLLPPDTIAINPLTWTRGTELAEKDLNLGALTNEIGKADVIVPGLYGAQIADTGFNRGQVVVCKELNDQVLPPSIFGTASLHVQDYSAYWENLRANVYDRGGKLAGLCKLCTTNFPAHFCISNATINLVGKSAFDVDSVAGTVWIPTNGLESAQVLLVPEKGYRLLFEGQEYPYAIAKITLSNLQADGEFLIPSQIWSYLSVEWIQRKPDYAAADGHDWLFNHDIEAKRYAGEPAADPGVDLFFLYPTSVYISDDHVVDGVCDIDDPVLHGPNGATNAWNSSAKVFGDFTRVYAPYYRQTPSDVEIPIGAQPNANAKMRDYWYKRAPYEDVTNALTHYFTKINPNGERPFIFAGHSHGSGMLSLVMEHFFEDHPEWLGNMVACYAIGWGVSKDWEAKLNDDLDMYVATNATDAGAYIFWNTYGPNTNATECILYPDPAKSAACVNPITWTREKDAYAPASLNLGAWTADDSGAVRPGLYDASNNVANGTLICTSKDVESKYLPPLRMFGEHSLHGWDYKLYWENLRANALQRIKTLNARRLEPDYAQIPLAGTPISYADPYNWVTNTGASKPLDVFYVYPTMMLEGDSTIVPVTDAMKAKAYATAYVDAASAFAPYANVLVPAYRQFHMGVCASAQELYTEPRDFIDFMKGQLPRTDLFAALDYYFTNLNAGVQRPFILAGHSQGSCMLKVALEDYFRSNDTRKGYLKKMVAAYPLGYSFSQDWFGEYYPAGDLSFATGETDTGVLIEWNTEGPNAQGRSFVIENGALAINPMNWTTTPDVWSETVPDAMIQQRTATNYAYTAGTYTLVTTNLTDYLDPSMGMGEKSLHGYDWKLWYDQVQANGFTRYAAFAGLKPVSTNSIPTVADTTWKVTVDGQEAAKNPVDGTYYVAADAKKVELVYTINPEKVAANFVFKGGKTTASFPLAYDNKADQWYQPNPVEKILEATKVIYNQRKPDYTQAKDWILNHYLKPDEARDLAGEPSQDSGVDLVYVYGTVAMTNAETTVDGFADIEDPQMRGDEATHTGGVWGMIPGSVKAFSDYTRVYMPFYRQMTLCGATNVMAGAGMEGANSAFAKALQEGVAYEDVAAALDAYFEKWNQGRPFILAGCSQGAALLRNMVQYYFTQNPDKLDQLVACYGIAFGVTKEWAEMIENDTDGKIHFATNATERGVYISWNTVGPDSKDIPNGLVPPDAISINPLTWTTEATPADVDKNYGALTNAATGAVVAHLYDATVDTVKGVVVSTNLPPSDYIKGLVWFGDKSLHTWEMPAWWENIRDNAYARIEAATGKRPCCGTPNDYAKSENWMVRGEKVGGGEGEVKPVDVFFLYPTTDTGKTPNLVAEIDDAMKATAWDAYQQDTMGFWSYANMYAPYYRQASFLGLQAQAGVGGLKNFCSTHVVKTDVFAALDYYFTNLNANAARPYILAGHSQGSCNIKLIFEEYLKDHPTYKEKLVAAYAMGFAVEKSWCKKAGVEFAKGESDTGKILTWNCEGPDAVHGPVNFLTEPDDGQAINPLNWKTDDTYADIGLNLGSVVTNAAGEYVWGKGNADAQLSPKAGSAYGFRPGALVVTNTTAAYSPEVLGYQSYHGSDGAFFQRNVGNNGFTRYAAFADLSEVMTNDVPKVADATWKVLADGLEAVVSPVDGKYYAPTDAQEVKLVYTVDPEKVAEGYRFVNGETTMSFAMAYSGGVWTPTATKTEIEAGTKMGVRSVKLGIVAQRYPWDGTVDVNYKAAFWPEGQKAAIVITVGETVVTNDLEIVGGGEIVGATNVNMRAIAPGVLKNARFEVLVR